MTNRKTYSRFLSAMFAIQPSVSKLRLFQSFLGALIGIAATGLVMRLWLGTGGASGLPLLIAPMGASAVLLFAVPASPLAQPWAIIGGNTLSALAGIGCMMLIGDPTYAAGCAVAAAIVVMSLARCLHPPGGAVALTTVIGGHAIVAAGWSFALVPVATNCIILVAIGWLFNNTTGHHYPHHAARYVAPSQNTIGYSIADIDTVLAQYDELLDVSRDDLDTLFRQVEARAYRRLHGIIHCAQIMSNIIVTLAPDDTSDHARTLFTAHDVPSIPVVDPDGHIEGLLSAKQLAGHINQPIAKIMHVSPCLTSPDTPIDELLPILSGGIYHEAIVVDANGLLLGMITQTDLLSAVWRGHVAEQVAGAS